MSDAPAPAAPEPATPAAAPATPAWTPPETFADRFSRASTRAVRLAVAAFGLLSLVLAVLWAVPAVVVARSASYALAKETVAKSAQLQQQVGAPIECAWLPERYRLGPDGDVFRFEFEGPQAKGEIELTVKDGKVQPGVRYFTWPKYY